MTTITITLEDELAARLRERAENLGVAPEELAHDTLQERFNQPNEPGELGEDFERVVTHILEKNAELYRRLA
ncbi:MAG TPA: hypothetical protein VGB77_18320 [Abditibacteriaceae bacterium]|jgi:predicted transcriptional regulator